MVSTSNGMATVTLGIRVDNRRILGRTIRLTGVALEPAVQAGGSVTVRFVSNGVVVEIAGRVRSSAAIGQTVEVTVNSGEGSGQSTHQGTVIAPGKVEVKL
jgi:flagella basal body P-ring formation protein FlgA